LAVADPITESIDRSAAALATRTLQSAVEAHLAGTLSFGPAGTVDVPPAVVRLLRDIMSELSLGHPVMLGSPPEAELSTSQVAEIVQVSRPHVAMLIDKGILRGRREGTHRRARLADVLAYRDETRRRTSLLDAMTA